VRIILADDSVLFREGLARLLSDAGLEVIAQAAGADQLLTLVAAHHPDLVIVDIRMPPTHTNEGLQAAQRIRDLHPDVAVLVLSQYIETSHVVRLIGERAGGVGYLLKDRVAEVEDFLEGVRRVGKGGSVIDPEVISNLVGRPRVASPLDQLTPREREVLTLMAEGRSNQSICERMYLSARTVESHVASIFTKLGLLPSADENRRVLAVLTYLRS